MKTVNLYDNNGYLLETIEIRVIEEYLMYRGRLFKWEQGEYVQKQYLEIY